MIRYYLLLTLFLALLCRNTHAQNPVHFNVVFADVQNNTTGIFNSSVPLSTLVGSGKITAARATFHSNLGNNTEGAICRWTVLQAFRYIESVVDCGNVTINYEITSDYAFGNPVLGAAYDFYDPADFTKTEIVQAMPLKHYLSGSDPNGSAQPEARININYARPFNMDMGVLPGREFDLYTVMVHEIVHCMGFSSLIEWNGTSYVSELNGAATGPYSKFDHFLYSGSVKLIDESNPAATNISSFIGNIPTSGSVVFRDPSLLTDYNIFSSGAFSGGSSLSHFDRARDAFKFNYIMQTALGEGVQRLQLDSRDIKVLCLLGYKIYGNLTQAPWGCTDAPEGVDDNVTYLSANQPNCISVLGNDIKVGTNDIDIDLNFGAVLQNSNAGTVTISNNQICFTASHVFCGDAIIQYRPVDRVTGRTGSVANLKINVPCGNFNPADPCNMVRNAGFEDGISASLFDNAPTYNDFDANRVSLWTGRSADLFVEGSAKGGGFQGIPSQPPSQFTSVLTFEHDYPSALNNRFAGTYATAAGAVNEEWIIGTLARTTRSGESYNISLWVQFNPNGGVYPSGGLPVQILFNTSASTTGAVLAGTVIVSTPDQWMNLSLTGVSPGAGYTHIIIRPDNTGAPLANAGYCFYDDIRMESLGPRLKISKTVDNATPAVGAIVKYTITVENIGSVNVKDIQVQDILDARLQYVSSTLSTNSGNTVTAAMFSLNPAQTHSFTIDASVRTGIGNECRVISNCAEIIAMKDNALNTVPNACFDVKGCADITVKNSNQECRCVVLRHPVVMKLVCASSQTLTLNSGINHQAGYDYEWTLPDNTTVTTSVLTLSPFQYGTYTLNIYKQTIAGRCLDEVFTYMVKEIIPQQTYRIINQPCESIFNLANSELYAHLTAGSTITWHNEDGSVITNLSVVCTTSRTIKGVIWDANGCELWEFYYNIITDCCIGDNVIKSYSKNSSIPSANLDWRGKVMTIETSDQGSLSIASGPKINLLKLTKDGTREWAKTFELNGLPVVLKSYLQHSNGDIYGFGYLSDWAVAVKLTSTGSLVWAKKINGVHSVEAAVFSENTSGQIDGIVFTGDFTATSVSQRFNLGLVKMDLNGNILWEKDYDLYMNSRSYDEIGVGIAISHNASNTPDGYVLLGEVHSNYNNSGNVYKGLLAIKIDLSGTLVKRNYMEFASKQEQIRSFVETNESSAGHCFLMTGVVFDYSQGSGGFYKNRSFIRKIDANLNELWTKVYDYTDLGVSLLPEKSQSSGNFIANYILLGARTETGVVSHRSFWFTLKLGLDGNLLNSQSSNYVYPFELSSSSSYDASADIKPGQGGSYIIAGKVSGGMAAYRLENSLESPCAEVFDVSPLDFDNITEYEKQVDPYIHAKDVSNYSLSESVLNTALTCCNNGKVFSSKALELNFILCDHGQPDLYQGFDPCKDIPGVKNYVLTGTSASTQQYFWDTRTSNYNGATGCIWHALIPGDYKLEVLDDNGNVIMVIMIHVTVTPPNPPKICEVDVDIPCGTPMSEIHPEEHIPSSCHCALDPTGAWMISSEVNTGKLVYETTGFDETECTPCIIRIKFTKINKPADEYVLDLLGNPCINVDIRTLVPCFSTAIPGTMIHHYRTGAIPGSVDPLPEFIPVENAMVTLCCNDEGYQYDVFEILMPNGCVCRLKIHVRCQPGPMLNNVSPVMDDKHEIADRLIVYPNVADNSLFIVSADGVEIEGVNVRLTDMNGKLLLEAVSATLPYKMNISELAAGMYIVDVRKYQSSRHFKIIKQ